MINLPLLLEGHSFTKVYVEADPFFQPEAGRKPSVRFDMNVKMLQHKEDPRKWQAVLTIKAVPQDDKPIPYKVDLECVGFFAVDPQVEAAKMPLLVQTNGAAVLFSSAREFLLLVTGRGPWPPLYLPTTNFLAPPPPAEEEASAKSPPKRPSRGHKHRSRGVAH